MNSYIAIEGIIGAGKTSLAKALAANKSWTLLEEPIHDPALAKLLPMFYGDPKKYAFALQIKMLHTRYRLQQVAAHSTAMTVLDRSLPGDRCFAALHTKYGNMSEAEWEVYQDAYDSMSAIRPPCLMVYLNIDPFLALDRIAQRGREMERGIDVGYLVDLKSEYDALIDQISAGKHHWTRGITIVNVDVSERDSLQTLVKTIMLNATTLL